MIQAEQLQSWLKHINIILSLSWGIFPGVILSIQKRIGTISLSGVLSW